MELAAARERLRAEHQRDMQLAWTIELLARQKTLGPDLFRKIVMGGRRQTREEQRAVIHQIAAFHGLELKRVPRVPKRD